MNVYIYIYVYMGGIYYLGVYYRALPDICGCTVVKILGSILWYNRGYGTIIGFGVCKSKITPRKPNTP